MFNFSLNNTLEMLTVDGLVSRIQNKQSFKVRVDKNAWKILYNYHPNRLSFRNGLQHCGGGFGIYYDAKYDVLNGFDGPIFGGSSLDEVRLIREQHIPLFGEKHTFDVVATAILGLVYLLCGLLLVVNVFIIQPDWTTHPTQQQQKQQGKNITIDSNINQNNNNEKIVRLVLQR